jgi:hypothetical protein
VYLSLFTTLKQGDNMQPGTTVIYKKYTGIIIRAQKEDAYIIRLYKYRGHEVIDREINVCESREYEQISLF